MSYLIAVPLHISIRQATNDSATQFQEKEKRGKPTVKEANRITLVIIMNKNHKSSPATIEKSDERICLQKSGATR